MADESGDGVNESAGNGDAIFYELALWRIQEQQGRIRALQSTLLASFAVVVAAIGLYAAIVAFRGSGMSTAWWSLTAAVGAVLVAYAECTFVALRIRAIHLRPRLSDLRVAAASLSYADTRLWAAYELERAYYENEPQISSKTIWVDRAAALALVEVVLVALTAIAVASPW